jgi:hypothetical protein
MDAASPALPKSLRWYEVLRDVYIHPSEKTFEHILEYPTASSRRAYIWAAVVGLLTGILGAFTTPGVPVTVQILTVVAGPFFTLLSLAISAVVLHWCAGRYKGQGTYSQMVYALGAISVPYSLIILVLFWVLPSRSAVSSLIQLALSLFYIYLMAQAIKAVEKLDNKRAFWTLILPLLLICLLAACFIITLALFGPAIQTITGS